MQSSGAKPIRCASATFIWLTLVAGVEGAGVRTLRDQQGIIPRDPPRLRIPHHAFQTWLSADDGPDETTLAKWMGEMENEPKKPNRVMNGINTFRARICWQMKDTHGEKFNSFHACKEFMEKACRPGGDMVMDGDERERPSQKGYCHEYFPLDEEEAEKELEEMEAAEAAEKAAAAKAAEEEAARKAKIAKEAEEAAKRAKEEADSKKKEEAGKEGKDAKAAPAKEEGGAAASPAPAAAGPAPAGAGLPANEAWYYKNGGKDPARYHMDEDMKLPTQGYWGRLVQHDDMKSATTDWHSEQPDSSFSAICKEHPENAWCVKKGYGKFGSHHSGSLTLAVSIAPTLLMLVATIV